MWSKFKTISCLNIWKKGITYYSSLKITHVTDWVANWLGWVASGGTRGGSLSIFLFHPFPFLYLSVEWNSSSVVRTRHMISIQAGESGRCITGSEWTTSCWPDQGRKTHVLLVLAGWLPAERVGNSCSRRDEGMETWTTWRRRRKRACLHVSTLP